MQLASITSSFASFPTSTVLLLSVGVLLLLLLGALIIIQLRNNARLHDLTYPVYDYTVKEAEVKANSVVTEAQEKARSIIAAAEVEAARVMGERSKDSEHLMAEYEKRLVELMHVQESALKDYAKESHAMLSAAGETFKNHIEGAEKSLLEELATVRSGAQELKAATQEEVKRLIAERLDKEFDSVRDGLESYRKERMKHVERDIVSIVEQAIAITLRRELPLKDHAELVYEALETAKQEGTFV